MEMTIFSFVQLIKEIYGKELPDLKKIEEKGLLAVKIAEYFALRVDFLDKKRCKHLSRLFWNNDSLNYEEVIEVVERYNGKCWLNIFEYFEYQSFSSNAIAQEHYAEFSNGEKAIIKIMKKDYTEEFVKDIERLKSFFRFWPRFSRKYDPIEILDYIKEYTMEELNFNNEIRGRKMLYDIAKEAEGKYKMERVSFPVIYEELSNEKVLVTRKVDGHMFDELLSRGKLKYETLLEFIHIHLYYLFVKGIFHGDAHPGNIILGRTGKIYLMDMGAVSKVEDKVRLGLFYYFKYLTEGDYLKCAYYFNKMSAREISGKKYEGFEKEFLKLYEGYEKKSLGQVSFTEQIIKTIRLVSKNGMIFEKDIFPALKSLMYIDGMVLRCNPKAKLLEDIKVTIGELEEIMEI